MKLNSNSRLVLRAVLYALGALWALSLGYQGMSYATSNVFSLALSLFYIVVGFVLARACVNTIRGTHHASQHKGPIEVLKHFAHPTQLKTNFIYPLIGLIGLVGIFEYSAGSLYWLICLVMLFVGGSASRPLLANALNAIHLPPEETSTELEPKPDSK